MKIRNILSTIILVLVLSLTVGFSAFVSEMSISEIVADIRVQKDVRITDVTFLEDDSWNVVSNYVDYDEDSLIGNVTFNDYDSVVAYKVTFTNFGNVRVYADVESYTGSISATPLDSMGVVEPLGGTFEVIMLASPEEIKTESFNMDFSFRRIFNVIYDGISGTNEEILEGDTYSVFLGEDVCDVIEIYMDGVRLDESRYDTSYGQLIISNITGDITIKEREKVARLMSGTLTEPGSEVCVGDECFYIMSNDGTTITMLAKYNLYVGYIVNSGGDYDVTEIEEPTGIQDENTLGIDGYYIGAVDFSDTGGVYAGSTVESYVKNYGSYLSKLGVKIDSSRLITKDELESFGCDQWGTYSCESAPSWIYSTAYWSSTDDGGGYLWGVDSYGAYSEATYEYLNDRGVRPVIEVAVGEVIGPISFTIDGVSYLAADGMTWGEWVDSDYNTLNLVYDSNGCVKSLSSSGHNLLKESLIIYASDEVIANADYTISGGHGGGSG